MDYVHVRERWQDMVNLVLNFAAYGYLYYSPVEIPVKKADRLEKIDEKIVSKYPELKLSAYKRFCAKKQGKANFAYIRWKNHGLLLRTAGEMRPLMDPDLWYSLDERPWKLEIGQWLTLKVGRSVTGKKYTVYIDKESYRDIKAIIGDHIMHHRLELADEYYRRLARLPSHRGICHQIDELRRSLKETAKKAGVKWKPVRLRLRPVYRKKENEGYRDTFT